MFLVFARSLRLISVVIQLIVMWTQIQWHNRFCMFGQSELRIVFETQFISHAQFAWFKINADALSVYKYAENIVNCCISISLSYMTVLLIFKNAHLFLFIAWEKTNYPSARALQTTADFLGIEIKRDSLYRILLFSICRMVVCVCAWAFLSQMGTHCILRWPLFMTLHYLDFISMW